MNITGITSLTLITQNHTETFRVGGKWAVESGGVRVRSPDQDDEVHTMKKRLVVPVDVH